MHPSRVPLAPILVLMVGILLSVIPAMASVNTTLQVFHTPDEKILLVNGSSWMILDNIPDQQTGDPVFLAGKTNLPRGSSVRGGLMIDRDPMTLCRMKTCNSEHYWAINDTVVQPGNEHDVNTFSMLIVTKDFLDGNLYNLSIYSDIGVYSDDEIVRIDKKYMTVSRKIRDISLPPAVDHSVFSCNLTDGLEPADRQFNDKSGGTIDAWYWDFGDGTGPTQQNPHHIFTHAGPYTVSLTISTATASGTLSKIIHVVPRKYTTLPFFR